MAKRTMWAVGPDDGEGWIAVAARCRLLALRAYAKEHDTGVRRLDATRCPDWDNLGRKPTGADWLRAGLGYSCAGDCGGMAYLCDGGSIVGGEPFCEYCKPRDERED